MKLDTFCNVFILNGFLSLTAYQMTQWPVLTPKLQSVLCRAKNMFQPVRFWQTKIGCGFAQQLAERKKKAKVEPVI